MHGTFIPRNRPLLIVDPWGHVLADPGGLQVGWDGDVFPDGGTGLGSLQISTLNRGRLLYAERNGNRDI